VASEGRERAHGNRGVGRQGESESSFDIPAIAARSERRVLRRGRAEWNRDVLGEIRDVIAARQQSGLDVRADVAASIESDRQAMLDAIRIAVYRLSGEIGGVVELGGGVSRGDSCVPCRALSESQRGAQCSVSVLVVEGNDAVGGMMRGANRESSQRAGAHRVAVEVEGVVRAASRTERCTALFRAPPRENLHDARHRVGAVENAGGASHNLDTINVVRSEMAEIEKATRRIHRHSIDEHLGVATFATAQEERCHRTIGAALNERCAGDFAKRVRHSDNASRAQIVAGKDGHGLRKSRYGSRDLGCGHDDRSELCRVASLSESIAANSRGECTG